MAITTTPYIPTYITVHLGAPESYAENVTVPFSDYIKNVASSEIYPTWQNAALRANIIAQVSFALNRIYTEYYPSRGYDFNITSSTAYDQKFIRGRNIFENISTLVDDLFTVYIRRKGFLEPLSASFCNGTTTTCDGLSQWGSEELAARGYHSFAILQEYYGEDIELVTNAPVQNIQYSYPGSPLRQGNSGPEVKVLQAILNRISQAYPALPKLWPVDGTFGANTKAAVEKFQSIFQLTQDGIVGKATWYKAVQLYVGLMRLSELVSEGQTQFDVDFEYPDAISYGNTGEKVLLLQYILSVLAQFDLSLPFVPIDGTFGQETLVAVQAIQQQAGLPQNGVVDEKTWNALVNRFVGISRGVLNNPTLFPVERTESGEIPPEELRYALTTHVNQYPGYSLRYGCEDGKRSVT